MPTSRAYCAKYITNQGILNSTPTPIRPNTITPTSIKQYLTLLIGCSMQYPSISPTIKMSIRTSIYVSLSSHIYQKCDIHPSASIACVPYCARVYNVLALLFCLKVSSCYPEYNVYPSIYAQCYTAGLYPTTQVCHSSSSSKTSSGLPTKVTYSPKFFSNIPINLL